MVIISCIIGALAVALASHIIISLVLRQRKLDVAFKWLAVYGVAVFAVTLATALVCFDGLSVAEMLLQYMLLCMMASVALMDFKYHFIPNKVLLVFLLLWFAVVGVEVIYSTEYGLVLFSKGMFGALVGGMIFLLCYLLSRGQLGAGDVKLVFVMGLYVTGDRIIGSVLYGVIACLIYSVIQLLRKKIGLKDGVPLAPFLCIGTVVTYFILS
jgi:prepilin signal peptidase PulO-like enzyme (type II secretory pathway)